MDFLKTHNLDLKFLAKFMLACGFAAPFADPAYTQEGAQIAAIDWIVYAVMAVVLLVSVGSSLAMSLTMKPDIEDAEPSALGDYGFPTNLESRYVPVVWGSTRIDGPNVIWYGDFSTYPLTTGGAIVGYRYFIGIDQALCWGTLDSVTALELDDQFVFKAGEERALTTGITPLAGFVRPSGGHRRIRVSDYNFTGGDKQGGGIDGDISFYYGTDDQSKSDYIASVLGEETTELANGSTVLKSTLLPNYAGVARMVWEGGYLTERATAPQFKVHVQRFPTSLTASFSKVRDDGTTADANPIHVIYEILTDSNWGCAIDPNLINRQSFIDAAEQCHSEGLGYSRTIDNPKQAKGVIDDINTVVNGILYQNAEGKFEYILTRKTYREWDNALLDYAGELTVTPTQVPIWTDASSVSNPVKDEIIGTLVEHSEYDYELNVGPLNPGDSLYFGEVGDTFLLYTNSLYNGWVEIMERNGTEILLNKAPFETGDGTYGLNTGITANGGSLGALFQRREVEYAPKVDPSTIIKVKAASRQSWEDTFNTIHLKYLDRTAEFKETVANAQDSGNMAIRNGVRKIKKVDMQGIRHPESAAIVAQRMLKTYAYPITSVDLEVSRQYSYLRPGSIIEINHPDFGLYDFYMRVLEVGLPKDTKGNVVLKGVRDVFDEPTNATTVQVGGSATLETITPTPAVFPSSLEVTSLPDFYCRKLGLDASTAYAWHILGAPNGTTTTGQAFQENNGIYEDVSDQAFLPATGQIVGHTSDLWEDRSFARRYVRESTSTSNVDGGPYAYGPGPHTNPIRHNSNTGDKMVLGLSTDTMQVVDHQANYIGTAGDILVKNLSSSLDQFSGDIFTEEQITNHGFGLALVRPAWAGGDSKYDEIIAYKEASTVTLYRGEYEGFASTYTGIAMREPDGQTFETHRLLSLRGVYRGLLDTGIQVLNTDSEILFIGANDPMYDRVGQSVASLQDETYRHAVYSVGSQTDPADATDQTVTAAEMERRQLPQPPVQVQKGTEGADQLWGRSYYDNGEYQGYFDLDGGASDDDLRVRWVSRDLNQEPGTVKLYSDTDAGLAGEQARVTLELVDDNRVGAGTPTQDQRKRHALAYYKEGWAPTNPPLSHGTGTDLNIQAVTLPIQAGANDTTFFSVLSNFSGTFTSNEKYYLIVSLQVTNFGSGQTSRGAQRFIYEVTAP